MSCRLQPPGTGEKPQREPALLSVEGRSWPVHVHYLEVRRGSMIRKTARHTSTYKVFAACTPDSQPPYPFSSVSAKEPTPDYIRAAVEACLQIHRSEGPGDILVFLTGEEARRRRFLQLSFSPTDAVAQHTEATLRLLRCADELRERAERLLCVFFPWVLHSPP